MENNLLISKDFQAEFKTKLNNEELDFESHELTVNKETESLNIEADLSQDENNLIVKMKTDEFENVDTSNNSANVLGKYRKNDSTRSDEENVMKLFEEKHNSNFHTMDKSNETFDKCSGVDLKMHEYLNTEDSVCNENSRLFNNKRDTYELNSDIRLCVDAILENVGLTGEKSDLINGFIKNEEMSSQNLSSSSEMTHRNGMKENNNCVIFPVNLSVSPDKNTSFTECLNTKNSSSGEKYINVNLETVSIDDGRINEKDRVKILTSQKIENTNNNENKWVFNKITGSSGKSNDTETCLCMNNKEISNLKGHLQRDYKYDTFVEHHAIISEDKGENLTKFLDIEGKSLRQQDNHVKCILEDNSYNPVSIDVNEEEIDYHKLDQTDLMSDNANCDMQKIENIQAKINFINSSINDVNREICEINNGIETKETELIKDYFNLNVREKSEELNQEIRKLNRSLQVSETEKENDIVAKLSDTETDDSNKQAIQGYNEPNNVDSVTADRNLEDEFVKDEKPMNLSLKDCERSNVADVQLNLEDISLKNLERSDQIIDINLEDDSVTYYEKLDQSTKCNVSAEPGPHNQQNMEANILNEKSKVLKMIKELDLFVETCAPILNLIEKDGELIKIPINQFPITEQNSEEIEKESLCENAEKNENVNANRQMTEIADEVISCLDTTPEGPNLTEREIGQTDFSTLNIGVSDKSNHELSVYNGNAKNQMKILNKELLALTKRKSKLRNISGNDSDIIIVSDNEEKNDKIVLAEKFNNINKVTENSAAQSDETFNEELDYELKNLKAQYSVIESKILKATKLFSIENVYGFISKVKEELTSYIQSLEELRIKFKSKLVHAEPKVLDEKNQSFHSFHQQQYYQEKNIENTEDKYRSQDSTASTKKSRTLYGKVESHQKYDYGSQMSSQGMVKTSHKFKERSEHISSSEKEACKSVHKKKFKLSHYSYEQNFQPSLKKKIENCGKKCCLTKNCTYSQEIVGNSSKTEPKFLSYNSDCHAKVGGFSKSFIEHKKLKFSKSSPKSYTDHINHSLSKPCCRKKICESKYVKKFKLHKRERYLSSDLSDSSDISSFSDVEFQPVRKDPKYFHGCSKYLKTFTSVSKLVKKASNPLKKERSKKRIRESSYESDVISIGSSDDDSVHEIRSSYGKSRNKEKPFKQNAEKKKVDSLINRQLDFINKCASKKSNRTDLDPASITMPNAVKKCQEDYSDEEKSSDERNKPKAIAPILEYGKKRKKASKGISIPSKLSKFRSHSEVHYPSKVKHSTKKSGKKLKSSAVSSLSSSPVSSMETKSHSPSNVAETRNTVAEFPTLKNKYNTEDFKTKLRSSVVSISSDISSLMDGTGIRKNEKKSGYHSTLTEDDQIKGQKQMKFRKFNKYNEKMFKDMSSESKNKEYSETETNDAKDMKSNASFSKKKREPKITADRFDKFQNASQQESRIDLGCTKNNSTKLKKRMCLASEGMSLKDTNEGLSVASGQLDSFRKLNEEMRMTNVKRKQMKSKIKNSNNNIGTMTM